MPLKYKDAKPLRLCVFALIQAEGVGFEPTVAIKATTVFETVPIGHSGTLPESAVSYPARSWAKNCARKACPSSASTPRVT